MTLSERVLVDALALAGLAPGDGVIPREFAESLRSESADELLRTQIALHGYRAVVRSTAEHILWLHLHRRGGESSEGTK